MNNELKNTEMNGKWLKVIAIITMFIDHVAAAVLSPYILDVKEAVNAGTLVLTDEMYDRFLMLQDVYSFMRAVGRIAMPIFCFLLVEGFLHTKNIKKYFSRLLLFALISEIPFDLAFEQKLIYWKHQNVFFTLALGLFLLWIIRQISLREKWNSHLQILTYIATFFAGGYAVFLLSDSEVGEMLGIVKGTDKLLSLALVAGLGTLILYLLSMSHFSETLRIQFGFILNASIFFFIAAEALHVDYGQWGVLVIVLFYFLRRNPVKGMAASCLALTCMSFIELAAAFAIIPIGRYNGKRGKQNKYFFYIFYPAHLLLLYGIYRILSFF